MVKTQIAWGWLVVIIIWTFSYSLDYERNVQEIEKEKIELIKQ